MVYCSNFCQRFYSYAELTELKHWRNLYRLEGDILRSPYLFLFILSSYLAQIVQYLVVLYHEGTKISAVLKFRLEWMHSSKNRGEIWLMLLPKIVWYNNKSNLITFIFVKRKTFFSRPIMDIWQQRVNERWSHPHLKSVLVVVSISSIDFLNSIFWMVIFNFY